MYLNQSTVEKTEEIEKQNSARMWRAKLWEGEWDSFLDKTDQKFTKSNPLISRLEMLKNSINFGFPTLALKIFKTKTQISAPTAATPKMFRYLSKYYDLLDHITDAQFLNGAFGSPYDVLSEKKIEDKGEHLFYLVFTESEMQDIDDFLEQRILKTSLENYQKSLTEKLDIDPELSFEDYMSLAHICLWYEKDHNAIINKVQNILINLWFKKFNRDIEEIKKKKSFNLNSDQNDSELFKEYESYNTNKPYPALIVSQIQDEKKLYSLYSELRNALDHFSFLAKGNKNIIIEDIQNYVYKEKIYTDGEVSFSTKMNFQEERLSKKQEIVLNLYKNFHIFMENVGGNIAPV